MTACTVCCLSFMQHWQTLAPHGPDLPMERSGLATACLPSQLFFQSTLLLILGGYPNRDCWISDILAQKWMSVGLVCEKVVMVKHWLIRHFHCTVWPLKFGFKASYYDVY